MFGMIEEAVVSAVIGAYVVIVGVIWKLAGHIGDKNIHARKSEMASKESCTMFQAVIQKQVDEVERSATERLKDAQDRIDARITELKTDMLREFQEIKTLVKNSHS